MVNNEAWKTATVRIIDALKPKDAATIVLSSGKAADVSELKYTVLDNQKVGYRDAQELAELHLLTKELPKNLVAFRPERLALHEIISAVTTKIRCKDDTKLDNDEVLQKIVNSISHDIKPQLSDAEARLDAMREKISAETAAIVKKMIANEPIPPEERPDYFADIQKYYDAFSKSDVKIGEQKPGYNLEAAVVAKVTDVVYTKIATKEIGKIVNDHIDHLIKDNVFEPLQIPAANERQTFMVCGGPASGKGSSVYALERSAEKSGIKWEDVAKINTDAYKPLLLQADTVVPELYSQLAQEEASLVNAKTQEKLKQLAEAGKAPHVLFDQVFVGPDQLKIAKINQGETKVMVVSTEVIDAVERSYSRGTQTGRFENTTGILNCHKNMTKQLPDRVAELHKENVSMRIVDNNVERGKAPITIADIDCYNGHIQIYDDEKMDRFIAKTTINPNAISKDEVYAKMPAESIDSYFVKTKYQITHSTEQVLKADLKSEVQYGSKSSNKPK